MPFTGFGARWFDADNDGWLDLLAVNGAVSVLQPLLQAGDPFPLHQRNPVVPQPRRRPVRGRRRAGGRGVPPLGGQPRRRLRRPGQRWRRGRRHRQQQRPRRGCLSTSSATGIRGSGCGWSAASRRGTCSGPGSASSAAAAGPCSGDAAGSDGSYASASDPRVLVGLGRAATVQRVEVIWPSGRIEAWTDLAAGRWLTLVEGTGRTLRVDH